MLVSILLHIAALALLVLLSSQPLNVIRLTEKPPVKNRIFLQPVPSPSKGGGGSKSPLPPSRGRLPLFAKRQFTPPIVVPQNQEPKLTVEPAIVMSASLRLDQPTPIGLPNGAIGPPSGGPGGPTGIGTRGNQGVGDSDGPGMEGRRAVPLSSGIKAPVVLHKSEPEYSEEARKARVQGTVIVEGVIDEKGATLDLRVRDGLGFGLDEQAIDAVKKWRFRPATRDGKPLAIIGTFYLTFRLL